jgi:hypothetical protein
MSTLHSPEKLVFPTCATFLIDFKELIVGWSRIHFKHKRFLHILIRIVKMARTSYTSKKASSGNAAGFRNVKKGSTRLKNVNIAFSREVGFSDVCNVFN